MNSAHNHAIRFENLSKNNGKNKWTPEQSMKTLWKIIPIWIKAILVGALLLMPVGQLNFGLIQLNIKDVMTNVPWSLPIVLCILWLYWQFTTGQSYPFKASAERKRLSSFQPIVTGGRLWTTVAAVALCILGASSLLIGYSLGNFDTAIVETLNLFFEMPAYTAIFLFLGVSIQAGIVEEIVFRGYMQTMMTERYGKVIAFLFIGFLFAFIHGLPPLLYVPYVVGSIGYSLIAHYSKSILACVITHAAFDFVFFLILYTGLINFNDFVAYNVFADGINDTFVTLSVITTVSAAVVWFACTKKLQELNIASR